MEKSAEDPFEWVGATIAGKYAIDAVVGEGGFGVVYCARHLGFEEKVAVKCLRIPTSLVGADRERFFASFMAEGRLLHQLSRSSSGIVQALDVGAAVSPNKTWTPYLILEWLEGKSLEQDLALRRKQGNGGRTIAEAIELLDPAARALSLVHEQGVAHRDIKPANLFLAEVGGRRTVKMLDFGIAKVITETADVTRAFQATGTALQAFTAQYAAPEQFSRRFGATGPWTDVFALALVFVETVSARAPLSGDDATQLFVAAADEAHRPTLRALGVDAPDSIEAVLRVALAVDPQQRYKKSGEFWDALMAAAIQSDQYRPEQRSSVLSGEALIASGGSAPNGASASSAEAAAPPALVAAESSGREPTRAATRVASTTQVQSKLDLSVLARDERATWIRVAVAACVATGFFAGAAALGFALWKEEQTPSELAPTTSASEPDIVAGPSRVEHASSAAAVPEPSLAPRASAPEHAPWPAPSHSGPSTLPDMGLEVPAGRAGGRELWVDDFHVARRPGDGGRALLMAQAYCAQVGRFLCTETQWLRACEAHPELGMVESWTLSAERGGMVVRGGKSCASQSIQRGSQAEPNRAGLCCERAVALDLKGFNTMTMTNLAKRLRELESAQNQREPLALTELLDKKVTIEKNLYSAESAGQFFQESFKKWPDQWTLLDNCEVSVKTAQTVQRTRRGYRKRAAHATWTVDCVETRHRSGEIAVVKERYVLNDGLELTAMSEQEAVRPWGPP
jgi:serine/threonine-protein kinase